MAVDLFGDLVAGTIARAQDLNDKFDAISLILNNFGSATLTGARGTLGNNSVHEDAIQDNAITQDKILLTTSPSNNYDIATREYVDSQITEAAFLDAFTGMFDDRTNEEEGSVPGTEIYLKDVFMKAPTFDSGSSTWYANYDILKAECSGYLTIITAHVPKIWITVMISAVNDDAFKDPRFGKDENQYDDGDPMEYAVFHRMVDSNVDQTSTYTIAIPKDYYIKIHYTTSDYTTQETSNPNDALSLKKHLADTVSGRINWGAPWVQDITWTPLFKNAPNQLKIQL